MLCLRLLKNENNPAYQWRKIIRKNKHLSVCERMYANKKGQQKTPAVVDRCLVC